MTVRVSYSSGSWEGGNSPSPNLSLLLWQTIVINNIRLSFSTLPTVIKPVKQVINTFYRVEVSQIDKGHSRSL